METVPYIKDSDFLTLDGPQDKTLLQTSLEHFNMQLVLITLGDYI